MLDCQFKIKDLGQLEYFLGIEVIPFVVGINLCQRKFYFYLLHDARLIGFKPPNTPFDHLVKLHQDTSTPFEDIASYGILVQKLLYFTTTRLVVAFAAHQLN